jgi:hypothetical protein
MRDWAITLTFWALKPFAVSVWERRFGKSVAADAKESFQLGRSYYPVLLFIQPSQISEVKKGVDVNHLRVVLWMLSVV